MYNLQMKFETTIYISLFSKELEKLLENLGNDCPKPLQLNTVEQTISISNIEKIPNKEMISEMSKALLNANIEVFKEKFDRNVTVKDTVFIGFSEIEEI